MYFIGVDLGTSACKFLLMDERGEILNITSRSYDVEYPHPGWSQQSPEDWWRAVREGVPELLSGFDAAQVAGIGCGGQMHGLVALDEKDQVIRPAILWNDGRTVEQVRYLNETVGTSRLLELTGNIAYAGFTAPKVLWMRDEEPELFSRTSRASGRRPPVEALCNRQGGAERALGGQRAAGERPPRARPWRRGSPGPVPNPEAKPAIAESTAAPAAGGQDVALAQGASAPRGPEGPLFLARGAPAVRSA